MKISRGKQQAPIDRKYDFDILDAFRNYETINIVLTKSEARQIKLKDLKTALKPFLGG